MTAAASDCILWKGAQRRGYPTIGKRLAHRVAYERDVATIPEPAEPIDLMADE